MSTSIFLTRQDAIALNDKAYLLPTEVLAFARDLVAQHAAPEFLSSFDAQADVMHFDKHCTHKNQSGLDCIIVHIDLLTVFRVFINNILPKNIVKQLKEHPSNSIESLTFNIS